MAKKLGKEGQISYRSTRELVKHLDRAAKNLAVTVDFGDRKLFTGHLVNALCLFLVRLPEDELAAFATPLLKNLEKYLDEQEPLNAGKGQPGDGPVHEQPAKPKPPRRGTA